MIISERSPIINKTRDKLITTEAEEDTIFLFNDLFITFVILFAKI